MLSNCTVIWNPIEQDYMVFNLLSTTHNFFSRPLLVMLQRRGFRKDSISQQSDISLPDNQ